MISIVSIFWIVGKLATIEIAGQEFSNDEVVETFDWTPETNGTNVEWKFYVIGRRVTWNVARDLCSSVKAIERSNDESLDPEDLMDDENSTITKKDLKINSNRRLAVLEDDKAKTWLSRMLSESNYRYDGLWIAGYRENLTADWTWMEDDKNVKTVIPSSTFLDNYPNWYRSKESRDVEKNCLIFDRVGHDLPILVPTDCHLSKPFLCSRVVTKKNPDKIVEGTSVNVDGYRYTLYSVNGDHDDRRHFENSSGVRKLNGGGVRWKTARLECRKRGQYLAVVLSNDAAIAIAGIMLKNRPSMESAWLGSWSIDGTDWTWSPTGFELSSKKSSISQYPPWLSGHPVTSSQGYYQKSGRCLVLDRHLCPEHMSPVFLDLDCEKKRPFVCQDGIPQRSGFNNNPIPVKRSIRLGEKTIEFSSRRMTWNDGREYCANNGGRIASIVDSETLSAVLDKMTDLYLDHVWVGGRTEKRMDEWRWFDETGKALSRKGIGARSSWCLGDDEDTWPKADPNACLNLDREGHGLPLFYGLPCDFAKQHVICTIDNASRSSSNRSSTTKISKQVAKSKNHEARKFFKGARKSFGPQVKINSWQSENDESTNGQTEVHSDYSNEWLDNDFDGNVADEKNENSNFSTLETIVEDFSIENSENVSVIVKENEDAKKVETNEGMKVGAEITSLSSVLQERIDDLANVDRSGMLFVIDDSVNVLDVWLAEELRFVAVVIRNIFLLSEEHPMGLHTLSEISRLAFNQTDACSVISHMNDKILGRRGNYRGPTDSHGAAIASDDVVKAAAAAADAAKNSGLQRVAVVFVMDKERKIANGNNTRDYQSVVEKFKILREMGHEVYALFVGQNFRTSESFFEFREMFGDSADGKRNIYNVQSFAELSELVGAMNSTAPKSDNDVRCTHSLSVHPQQIS